MIDQRLGLWGTALIALPSFFYVFAWGPNLDFPMSLPAILTAIILYTGLGPLAFFTVPAVFALQFGLFRQHEAAFRIGTLILFLALLILSAIYMLGSWRLGLAWQGLPFTVFSYVQYGLIVGLLLWLAFLVLRDARPKHSCWLNIGCFFALNWGAFPWLGEML